MKAFPIIDGEANYKQEGMDLRDYFAAKAMQAVINACFSDSDSAGVLQGNSEKYGESEDEHVARISYQFADAMMEARNEQ